MRTHSRDIVSLKATGRKYLVTATVSASIVTTGLARQPFGYRKFPTCCFCSRISRRDNACAIYQLQRSPCLDITKCVFVATHRQGLFINVIASSGPKSRREKVPTTKQSLGYTEKQTESVQCSISQAGLLTNSQDILNAVRSL
jgi:hypothetical protein